MVPCQDPAVRCDYSAGACRRPRPAHRAFHRTASHRSLIRYGFLFSIRKHFPAKDVAQMVQIRLWTARLCSFAQLRLAKTRR